MALNYDKLRKALALSSKEGGAPNRTLDIRIEVRGIDKPEVGDLIWKVSSPDGGYGRNTNQAASALTMISLRIADMERAVRREIESGVRDATDEDLEESDD
jgi:hypothetical protein